MIKIDPIELEKKVMAVETKLERYEIIKTHSYLDKSLNRYRVNFGNGEHVTTARVVWNACNPNNPVMRGDGYSIHHIDENSRNDHPDNLEKINNREHGRLHATGQPVSEETRRYRSEMATGENHPNAKLTDEKVKAIRGMHARNPEHWTYKRLGALFNVTRHTVRHIVHRKSWKHLP